MIITQAALTQQAQPVTQPQTPTIDVVTAFGYLLAASATTFMLAPKILERWIEDKRQLHKSDAEIELESRKRELEAAAKLSDFYYQAATESRKKEGDLLTLFVTKELDSSAQMREQLYELIENQKALTLRLEALESAHKHSSNLLQDILNVLQMKDR